MSVRPPPLLAIVVPCFNESEAIDATHAELTAIMQELVRTERCAPQSVVIYVDDGSGDRTWDCISRLVEASEVGDSPPCVAGVRLARNAGHQAALLAGLRSASRFADAVVSIDADLQDDPKAIVRMVDTFMQGADVVLGVRKRRDTDTAFKRWTARCFYRFLRALGVDLVPDHADYRLLSRSALHSLMMFDERALFLRALPTLLSSRVEKVYYDRAARVAGESKYCLSKMLSLAWKGITANSIVPLRGVLVIGTVACAISLIALVYAVVSWTWRGVVPGWTSLAVPLYLMGGIIMLSIGLLGEYLGRVYMEVKRRPLYFVDTEIGLPAASDGDVRRAL